MAPRPESEPKPEKSSPEPSPEMEHPAGEPGPEWGHAKKLEGWLTVWDSHWIGIAVLYGLLTLFALYCLRRFYRRKQNRKAIAKFSLTVTAVIALFTLSRFLYLIINPYESPLFCIFGEKNCPLFINRFLFSLGMPSLVSAYFLLFLALRDVAQMKVTGKFSRLQSWYFLGLFVFTNYAFSCTADLVVAYVTSAKLFLALCQGYFILLSACLVCAFFHAGMRIYITNRNTQSQIAKMSMKRRNEVGTSKGRRSVRKVVRLAIVTAILGALVLILEIFALAYVYVKTFTKGQIDPWPWLVYIYAYRLVEAVLAGSILYNISFLPNKGSFGKATKKSSYLTLKGSYRTEAGSNTKGETSNNTLSGGESHQTKANENAVQKPQNDSKE